MLKFTSVLVQPVAWVTALFVAGCALLPGLSVNDAVLEFELQGRIAMHYGKEGGNARITWRHGLSADDLLVTNPLGQGIARITRQGSDVRLVTADTREHRASDAEMLTESVLGWRLPLAGLPDWVRGRAVPGRPSQLQRSEDGRITRIEQDAWRIDYLAWEGELPSRLTLAHEGGSADSRVEIRLIIDQWRSTP